MCGRYDKREWETCDIVGQEDVNGVPHYEMGKARALADAVTGTGWEGIGVIGDAVAGGGEWEGGGDVLVVGRRLAKLALWTKEPVGEGAVVNLVYWKGRA